MKTKKYTNNLQKSSVLFLQLGLVLTLLTVYTAFELKTEQRTAVIIERPVDDEPYEFVSIKEFRIEEKIVKKTKRIAKKQPSTEFKIDDTPTQKEDAPPFVQPTDPVDDNPIDDELVTVYEPEELSPDGHLKIDDVEEIPIFPGCEKVKKSKQRACFEKKISKHIQRKFNSNLAGQLGLSSGKKKIRIEFVITKTGEIKITNASAPHIRLEKEGKRVVNKLPTMIPGKQNGKVVGVKYQLPISFEVE